MQGNIIAILNKDGKVIIKYFYDAWGKCSKLYLKEMGVLEIYQETPASINNVSAEIMQEIGERNPFRYRGYYYDTETNLYYLQTRYYDPEVGRFISQDSVEYADPETINGLNLYAYCGNNPVMNVDPTGEFFFSLLFAILAGAVIGGVIGGVTAVSKDDDFWGGFLSGALVGGVLGGVAVLGGATMLVIAGKTVSGFIAVTTFAGKAALLATTFVGSTLISVGAGMGAYAIQEKRNGREIDTREMVRQGIMTGIKGVAAYITGIAFATTGFYNDLLGVKFSFGEKIVRSIASFISQFPWKFGLK